MPFSGIKNTTKIAEANSAIKVYGTTTKTDKTITIYALVDFGDQIVSAEESLSVFLFDGENPDNLIKFSDGTYGASLMVKHNHQNEGGSNEILPANIESELKEISKLEGIGVYYKKVFTGLTPNHDYQIRVVARHKGASMWEIIKSSLESQIPGKTTQVIQEYVDKEPDSTTIMQPDPMIIRTSLEGETTNQSGGSFQSFNEEAFLPSCTFSKWAIDDCFAVVLYQLVFKTTSYIFGLSGKFIDATLNYSIQDSSYRSTFVVEGWGIVRDMCNMFFIFILLYVAFATILNLHGFNPKSIIVNVVIIGLLINFSMLATQIIIDTSNIMAKVFYNRISVVKTINGIEVENPGGFGEKKLSEGLVNKVNPQSIIINAGQASVRDSKFNAYTSIDAQAIGGGTFIMVTILASIMNIVGIIAFLSAGLIMVTRVVGLWVAIILSPLAFFSYILPKMQDMEMVGWKKWWPETIKMAFLAPVFIFFMYLITMFLEKGLGAFDADGKTGLDFFIATIVPFAFLMILLMKAKDIAKDMSGKMGQSITNGVAALGGMALGGAALGAAALGRGLITNPMKMMQSSQSTRDAALKNLKLYNPSTWGKAMSAKMANMSIEGKGKGVGTGVYDITTRKEIMRDGSNPLRDKLLAIKKDKGDKAHATHLLDEQADKIEKGKKFSELNTDQQQKAKDDVQKEQISKFLFNGKTSDKLDSVEGDTLRKALASDKAALDLIIRGLKKDPSKFHGIERLEEEYNKKDPGIYRETLTSITGGSYDLRNAQLGSVLKPAEWAMKLGMHGLGISVQKGQRDFIKDLTNVLEKSMKDIKVDVKIDGAHGGGGHAKADAHGGDHGGGHH